MPPFKGLLNRLLFNRTSAISLMILLPVHFCLAKISGIFAFEDATAIIWPSTGIFLAATLILGYKVWLPMFISDWIVGEVLYYKFLPLSFSIAAIDTIEVACVGLVILHFVKRRYPFDRVNSTLRYMSLLVPIPLVTAGLAIATLCLFRVSEWNGFWLAYKGWLCGMLTGGVVITPLILCVWHSIQKRAWRLPAAQLAEFSVVFGLLILIGLTAFSGATPVEYGLIFPLIWSAIRFSPRESAFLAVVMSAIAIYQTLHGHGSFAQDESTQAAVLLQLFIASLTIAALVLSAAIQENRQANDNLRHINEDLENRVEGRTEELSNALRELRKTQTHLVQQEKMSGLGQMVAGVAHEINNPVNFIHGNLTYIQQYAKDMLHLIQLYQQHFPHPPAEIQAEQETIDLAFLKQDLAKVLTSMTIGTTRITEIVLSLRNFSRMDESESKVVDIHAGIESTLMILQHRLKASSQRPAISVVRDYGQLPLVQCYAGQLNQVFMNLLVNSIDALETDLLNHPNADKSPQITLRTEARADSITVSIADNGTGISPDVKRRMFDPFFTTKEVGKGTGMGMAISYQLITEKHGGKIECFSEEGAGTEFMIEIPICLSADVT
ncbi:MASE1 domain-containing protein [Leptolyngbya sp. BC1307]|uniref:MASE1 domain-containing protein n=1 Tax=Leptolyngbya sp. BC1307 TaxID=2029589 RepID=UPI000EFB5967|nr:MASE1 domain-containing protein [Leptolyngbya sp. BC1307]